MFKLKRIKKKSFVPINCGRWHCGRWLCAVAISALLTSCGGGSGDEGGGATGSGGIIGTGIRLEGTASSKTLFATNEVEVKSSTGEKSLAPIGNRGRFQLDALNGAGPFLLRALTGDNTYLYSIGYPQANGALTKNIHSYTDAAARNWFASNGLDIDSAFMGDSPIAQLPPQATLNSISGRLQSIVSGALKEYNLTDTDLDTVDFESDDSGVDLFLDSNPVVINNGTINILILDQTTQVVTQSSTDLSLATDLVMEDIQPPSAPESVRALAATPNEIVVVWNASTDNIGVTAYQVFRDGALIATTPFPVFTDTGLLANAQYSYTIVAIDSSGLTSAESVAAMSATQGAPDITAPPTPLMVLLEPGLGGIGVSWSQAEIFDVKAFNVYRTGTAEATFKVTSDFINDVNVLSGSEYCYAISAEDASGNESARTAVQCATTSGAPATTPPVVVTPTQSEVTPGVLQAPTLDVTTMACTQELPDNGTFNTDSVLTAGCYLAPRGIRINEPANLTVEPGVVVKFAASQRLLVDRGASLTAIGNATAPIVFSSVDPTPGFWDGVRFTYSNSSRNQLDFVQIEYAGDRATDAGLTNVSLSTSPARISIKNSTVRFSLGYGIEFGNNSIVGAFEGNLLTGNNAPLLITPDDANALAADSTFSGNTNDHVRLSNVRAETSVTLAKLDVPYITDRITVDNSLTVEPGVTILFEAGGELQVNSDATLKAVGTALEPILFTATDPTPGFWDGVEFSFSPGNNEISHVTVEYGGSGTRGTTGNIRLRCGSSRPTRLSIDNATLNFGLEWGMYADSAGCEITLGLNMTYTNNGLGGFNLMP